MTAKRDSKSKPKADNAAKPPVKDLDPSEKETQDVRGGKVAMNDISFTKKVDKSSPS
jgi:type VI protein secretion system component Hcp